MGQGAWETVGKADYRVNGNGIELAISRKLIGLDKGMPTFDFHWADNIQGFSDASEFGVNGDSAPDRRCNYRYEVAP